MKWLLYLGALLGVGLAALFPPIGFPVMLLALCAIDGSTQPPKRR